MNNLDEVVVKFVADITDVQDKVKKMQSDISKAGSSSKGDTNPVKSFVDSATSSLNKGQKNIVKPVAKIQSSVDKLSKSFKSLARLSRFLVFSYIGRQIVNLFQNLITAGSNMAEIENLFEVSFGNMTESANNFAKSLENAWGVSQTTTKQQTAYLNNMIKSMGLAEDTAYDVSTSMVQLSHNIASLYDISQEDVLVKLRSALVGVSRPLLQLGINTKVAQLQQVAFEKGITSTNRELTQQEKVLATVWAIYEQTQSSWKSGTAIIDGQEVAIGDMTKTISTNANMMRVLRNRVTDLGRVWGLAFQPIISYVLPILYKLIEGLAMAGNMFANFMAKLFGYESKEDLFGLAGSAEAGMTDDLIEGLDGVGSAADEAAEKINNLTGGVDELNILQEPDTSGATGAGGVGVGDIENDIGRPDWDTLIGGAIDETVAERINQLKEAFGGLDEVLGNIVGFTTPLLALYGAFKLLSLPALGTAFTKMLIYFEAIKSIGIGGVFSLIGESITAAFSSIGSAAGAVFTPIGAVIALIALVAAGFVYLYTTSEDFKNAVNAHGQELLQKILAIASTVYNEVIKPLTEAIVEFVQYVWDNGGSVLIENVTELIFTIINLLTDVIGFLLTKVLPIIIKFISWVIKAVEPLAAGVAQVLGYVVDIFNNLINFFTSVFSGDFEGAMESLVNIANDLFKGIKTIFDSIIKFAKNVFLTAFGGVFVKLASTVSSIFGTITNKISSSLSFMKRLFNSFTGFISSTFVGGFKGALKSAVNAGIDVLNSFGRSIAIIVNSISNGINSISVSIPSWVPWFGGKTYSPNLGGWNFNSIPRLYDGGVAYGDTLARVGDYAGAKANPEVIAPLSTLSDMMVGNSGTSQEELILMSEQNELLRQLLDKDTSVRLDGREIARSVKKNTPNLGYNLGVDWR